MKSYYRPSTTYLRINAAIILLVACQALFAQNVSNPWMLESRNPNPSGFPNYDYDSSDLFSLFVQNCSDRLPLFKDKLICFDLLSGSTICTFRTFYPMKGCGGRGVFIYYSERTCFDLVNCYRPHYSFNITNEKIGTSTYIYIILNTTRNNIDDTYSSGFSAYSGFTIRVVSAPKWNAVNALCQKNEVKLEDFTTTPTDTEIKFYYNKTNELIPRDNTRGGTFLQVKDIPLTVKNIPQDPNHTTTVSIRMERTYDNGTYTEIKIISLLPDPPQIDDPQIVITPSCRECPSGKIFIPSGAITTRESNISWVLRTGHDTSPCNPCSNTVRNNNTPILKSDGITIDNLSAQKKDTGGKYTLMVTNNSHNCYNPFTFEIGLRDPLKIDTINTHIACRGASSGQIEVNASGGDAASQYTITLKEGSVAVSDNKVKVIANAPNTTKTWHNLPAGTYKAEVKDGKCEVIKDIEIELKEPIEITAAPTHTNPICSSPPNGTIQVSIANAASYTYDLFKDNGQISKPGTTTSGSHTLSSLEAGSYIVKIKNPDVSGCVLTSIPVTLGAPTPLGLRVDSNPIISCFGASTGRLELTGSGGSGSYTYILNNNGALTNQETGIFPGLPKGTYTVTLKNRDAACTDSFTPTVPYTVSQRTQLSVVLESFKITCHQAGDGKILSTPSGGTDRTDAIRGTDTYNYHWKYKDNANEWQAYTRALSTQKDVSNMAPGTYRVVLEDGGVAGCEITSSEIVLTNPAPLQIVNVLPKDAVCKADGAHIEVTATGGYGNYVYSYSLNDGETYTDFTREKKFATGSYKIKVRDTEVAGQEECSVESSLTYRVTVPDVPLDFTLALSQTKTGNYHISCHGEDSGTITATVTANSGNGTRGNGAAYIGYHYKSGDNQEYQDTGIFGGLPAGDYSVSVKDARECVVTKTVTLRQPPVLAYTGSKTNINCFGNSTGTLTPNVTGGVPSYNVMGVPSYTVTVNDIVRPVNSTITGLAKGSYQIHIVDAHNCTADATVSIDYKHDALRAAVEEKDIKCFGEKGRAIITPTGGDSHYTIRMSSNNWAAQGIVASTNELEAGTYHFKVEDGLGCSVVVPQPVVITSPPSALSFNYTLSDYGGFNISCRGGSNGRAALTAGGGNGSTYIGYQYKHSNGEYQAADTLTGLPAGNYTLYVKDARGCVVTRETELRQPLVLLAYSGTKTDIDCFGASTGSITSTVTGGVPAYQLKVNEVVTPLTTPLTGLAKGDYNIRVTDAAACTVQAVVSIQHKHDALTATVEEKDIKCFGEKGRATITPSGGNGRYTIQISSDNWATQGIGTTINELGAGTYHFKVEDGLGCSVAVPQSVVITSPPSPLSFTYTLSDYSGFNISCKGGSNGYASLTASGGNGENYSGYTFALDDGAYADNPGFNDLHAGQHTLKVKDARLCVVTSDVLFTESQDILSIRLVSKEDVPCANSTSGTITVLGQGGTGELSELRYSRDNKLWQSSTTFSNLPVAAYRLQVKDLNECKQGLTVDIHSNNPAIIVDRIRHQEKVCFSDLAGIQVEAHGGTGTLTPQYSRNGGDYISFTPATPLEDGDYIARVKDGAGCFSAVSHSIRLTSPPEVLAFSVLKSDYHGMSVSCHGLSNGSFSLHASGGNGATYSGYTYSLNEGDFGDLSNFTDLPSGDYSLKVKDGRGCISTQNLTLKQPDVLSFDIKSIEGPKCNKAGTTGQIVLQAAQGGTPAYQYSWDGVHWQPNTVFEGLLKGHYTFHVKDVNECTSRKTAVLEPQYTPIVITASITHVKCFGQFTGAINAAVSGGHGNFACRWNNEPAQAAIQNLPAGNYQLRATDESGCLETFDAAISQPPALTLQLESPSICDGHTNGKITATAAGGVTPYLFSLNDKAGQESNIFNNLTHETYTVKVADAHACTTTVPATIGKLNVKPNVNFLAATRKNALDTLAIKEISLPAPDSVNWVFDPRLEFLGYEDKSPLIKCKTAGTYWMEMTGQWNSCHYVVKKEITIQPYDPLAGPGKRLPVKVIGELTLSPNPTHGNLHLSVKLNRKQQLTVFIYSMSAHLIERRQYAPGLSLEEDFTFSSDVSSGTYIFRVIAENDSRDMKFILTR